MSPARSASPGVEVAIEGWRAGLNKVELTLAFRRGGYDLAEASRLTGEVLEGREVRVRLGQFETVAAARRALTRIGIDRVSP